VKKARCIADKIGLSRSPAETAISSERPPAGRRTFIAQPLGCRRGVLPAMRRTLLILALVGCGTALAAPPSPVPPKEETAVPLERPGETDEGEGAFPALPVPQRAVQFSDPAVSGLAAKILTGNADLRDRRAWYAISLLYSPFEALPPAGWRSKAVREGELISVESRRRQAAATKLNGAIAPAVPLANYSWSSLGPVNYEVGSGDLAQGRASSLWVHPTNTDFIFARFAGGGVWKTTNGGGTWIPLSDFEVTTSVGSLDVLMRTDTTNLSDAIEASKVR